MAIMDSLADWCQYLLGTKQPVEIFTDHQNLQYFKKPQKLNSCQARWVMEQSKYVIQLYHKPGKTMGKADALSRMTGLEKGGNDNKNVILLKPKIFISNVVLKNPKDNILSMIKR